MNPEITKKFFEECNKWFGFLVLNHGYRAGVLDVDRTSRVATVSYVGRNLAVQCVFDEKENWTEVDIARVSGGKILNDHATNGQVGRMHEGLYPLLIRQGVRDFGPRDQKLSEQPLEELFRLRLSKDADLIRRFGGEILSDSSSLLDAKLVAS